MRCALVKMSSMGDIFHTFPALSDLADARPDVSLDWVVEEGLATVAGWHPFVATTIPIGLRRWLRQRGTVACREFQQWRSVHCLNRYDLLIDAQGLFKSGLIARILRAKQRHGYDHASAREPLASFFSDTRHRIGVDQHAVARSRQLFGMAFGYKPEGPPRFGIRQHFADIHPSTDRLVFIIGTTWTTKLWATTHWQALIDIAANAGFRVELIWGSPDEHKLALALAGSHRAVTVSSERLTIGEVAKRVVMARAVFGLDTGFTHLAGALETPTLGLFGPTSPIKVGLIGEHTYNLKLDRALNCQPCHKRTCHLFVDEMYGTAPCLDKLDAARVWHALSKLMHHNFSNNSQII